MRGGMTTRTSDPETTPRPGRERGSGRTASRVSSSSAPRRGVASKGAERRAAAQKPPSIGAPHWRQRGWDGGRGVGIEPVAHKACSLGNSGGFWRQPWWSRLPQHCPHASAWNMFGGAQRGQHSAGRTFPCHGGAIMSRETAPGGIESIIVPSIAISPAAGADDRAATAAHANNRHVMTGRAMRTGRLLERRGAAFPSLPVLRPEIRPPVSPGRVESGREDG